MVIRFALCMLLAIPSPGITRPAPGALRTTYGAGITSCGQFVATSHGADRNFYHDWVGGYLSGVGTESGNSGIDMAAAMLWLENYCHAHPLDQFFTAADALSHATTNRRYP